MPSVRLARVDFGFGPYDIFKNLSLRFSAGWTGLVGPNGTGKTTLLRLVGGALVPHAGHVERSGMDAHYCPQQVASPGAATHDFACSWERRAIRLRADLSLEESDLDRWTSLSPGERKRWQIGTALFMDPEILLLDEPSNHLDAAARDLLVAALSTYRGVGLLVSHDRGLLDALCQHTVFLEAGSARPYRGNYSAAAEQRGLQKASEAEVAAQLKSKEQALQRRLATTRHKHAQAERALSSKTRMKSHKDSDARSSSAKARAQNGEARLSRSVGLTRKTLDDVGQARASIPIQKARGRSLFVDYQPAPMTPIISLAKQDLRVGDRRLLRDVQVSLARHARIRLCGPNGSGKTTLLRALMRAAGARADALLYLPQEITAAPWRDASPQCCNLLAALGVDPSRLRASLAPSPGELKKYVLAEGLARGAWAVLLDEPTNHLDLPSIERLQEALVDYPGALLLVSHDDAFARALTDEQWHLTNGVLEFGADG